MPPSILKAQDVRIDYPGAGETVAGPEYAVRICAAGAEQVEVSIDHGRWMPCRFAAGFWWFDWSGYGSGIHQIRTQVYAEGGRLVALKGRQVPVRLEAQG